MKSLITKLTVLVTVVAAMATGVPLIFMVVDAAINKGDCFAAKAWDWMTEL